MGEKKGKHLDYSKREMIANWIEQKLNCKTNWIIDWR